MQGPCIQAIKADQDDMMLDFACEADDVGLPGSIYAGYR